MLHYFRNFWGKKFLTTTIFVDLFNVLFCCNLFRSTPLAVYLHKRLYEGAIGCASLYRIELFCVSNTPLIAIDCIGRD